MDYSLLISCTADILTIYNSFLLKEETMKQMIFTIGAVGIMQEVHVINREMKLE